MRLSLCFFITRRLNETDVHCIPMGNKPIIHSYGRNGHGLMTSTPIPLLNANNEMWHKASSTCWFPHFLFINTKARFIIRQNKQINITNWSRIPIFLTRSLQDPSSFFLSFISLDYFTTHCFKHLYDIGNNRFFRRWCSNIKNVVKTSFF